MVPQPVKAVILLFPFTGDFKKKRDARYAQKLEKLGEGHIDPTVIWIKQTVRPCHFSSLVVPGSRYADTWIDGLVLFIQIGNACGTMSLLHALANVNCV